MVDLGAFESDHPDLVADVRAEAEHIGLLSRTTLERLSCDCEISRIITDGPGMIIDVGRTTRNVPDKLWRTLVVATGTANTPAVIDPPAFCEAHHVWYWSHGGPTNLNNFKLLCWQHHREIHIHDNQRT